MAMARLRPILTPATGKHTATLLFLHGSGDTGCGIKDWLNSASLGQFSFPHIRIIYPTAPVRPYTPMGGFPTNVWFDRLDIDPLCDEDEEGVIDMCNAIKELVDNEVKKGIATQRIMIGGFSMGAALTMHCGYRFCPDIAGMFALSGFLSKNSSVFKIIKESTNRLFPSLYQTHGDDDTLINVEWARDTNSKLKNLGVQTQFKTYEHLPHAMNLDELQDLRDWIFKVLPEHYSS